MRARCSLGAGAAQQIHAAARHARGPVDVDDAQPFADLPVRLGLEGEPAPLPLRAQHHVVVIAPPRRRVGVHHVGKFRQRLLQLRLALTQAGVQIVNAACGLPLLRDQAGALRLVRGAANGLAGGVAQRLQLLHLAEQGAPLLIERQGPGQRRLGLPELQHALDFIRVLADELDGEHRRHYCVRDRREVGRALLLVLRRPVDGGDVAGYPTPSGWKISSIGRSNNSAILNASGRLGSYLLVSMALMV